MLWNKYEHVKGGEIKTYPWIQFLNGLLYPRKHVKERREKETKMLEIDKNVNFTFIITGSIKCLYGRAAEHNVGSGPCCVGTDQKEKQNSALRRAILRLEYRTLSCHREKCIWQRKWMSLLTVFIFDWSASSQLSTGISFSFSPETPLSTC